jgi:hypothetical protein
MKRMILFLCLSCMPAGQAAGQRYFPGQTGIQLTAGLADGFRVKNEDGAAFYGGAAISFNNRYGNRFTAGAEYFKKQFGYGRALIPVEQFTAEGGFFHSFLSDRGKNVFLSIGASALAGYEMLNRGKSLLSDGASLADRDGFIYGGALTLEVEIFLADRLVLLLNARERILSGSAIQTFHFQAGAGIKVIIN